MATYTQTRTDTSKKTTQNNVRLVGVATPATTPPISKVTHLTPPTSEVTHQLYASPHF